MFLLKNATLFTGIDILPHHALLINEGKIIEVLANTTAYNHLPNIDLEGLSLAPGFIDLQVYGGGGSLFNTKISEETIEKTYRQHRLSGTTQFQITLSTMPLSAMLLAAQCCKSYQKNGGKGLLGLHLEGPYFSMPKRGAHLSQYIRKASLAELKALIEATTGLQTYITIAPEEMSDACLELLLNSHIQVSAGHSSATFEQATSAFAKGISRVTHLFNAMTALQSREPGLVGATYLWGGARASIIADGIHCHYEALSISKKIMGERLFLITDAVTEDQRGEYNFRFAGNRFVDTNGTLSGSALSMMQAVSNCVNHAHIPLDEALRMASTYPAQVAEIDQHFGRLSAGYWADMVIFDANLEVKGLVERGLVEMFGKPAE